jgi:hypothetical protein
MNPLCTVNGMAKKGVPLSKTPHHCRFPPARLKVSIDRVVQLFQLGHLAGIAEARRPLRNCGQHLTLFLPLLFQVLQHDFVAREAGYKSKLGIVAGVLGSISRSVALHFPYGPAAQSHDVQADA